MSQPTLRGCVFHVFAVFIACLSIQTAGTAPVRQDGDPAAQRIKTILQDYQPALNLHIRENGLPVHRIDVPNDLTYLHQLSPVATLKTLSTIVEEDETEVAWKAAVAGICVGEESSLHLLLAHGRNFDTPDKRGETPRHFWLKRIVRRLQESQQQEMPVLH